MKLFVSNFPVEISEEELAAVLGNGHSITVRFDVDETTGYSTGSATVELDESLADELMSRGTIVYKDRNIFITREFCASSGRGRGRGRGGNAVADRQSHQTEPNRLKEDTSSSEPSSKSTNVPLEDGNWLCPKKSCANGWLRHSG